MADTNSSTTQTTQTATSSTGSAGSTRVIDLRQTGASQLPIQLTYSDAQIEEIDKKYSIPKLVKEKYPDLVPLILQTESMKEEERVYWFQILPIMSEDQIVKFRGILVNEKEQLTKLDLEYEQELKKLNEKHLVEWTGFERKEKREKLVAAEDAAEKEDSEKQDDLLKKLSDV